MKAEMAQTFRENRAKYPIDELRTHCGKWVAFSADGGRIVASDESMAELSNQIRAAGEDPGNVVFERIELDADNVYLGGAELQ